MIPYYDDINCVPVMVKNHCKGVRNIYSVKLCYSGGKVYDLPYGSFGLAMTRYYIESGSDKRPQGRKLNSIQVLVSTYSGTKKVNEDTLMKVVYNKKNPRLGESAI